MLSIQIYSQKVVDNFKIEGYVFSQERHEVTKVTDECGAYLNGITLMEGERIIFEKSICGVDVGDDSFINKGYLTILEHYSSPVGWFEYYVFDLCKKRIIKTKRLDEGVKVAWEKFIELDESFRKQFVVEVVNFK